MLPTLRTPVIFNLAIARCQGKGFLVGVTGGYQMHQDLSATQEQEHDFPPSYRTVFLPVTVGFLSHYVRCT
jgi:hypothetical protein